METNGYGQLCDSFRQLTDVRFKLLALVPSISGTAIALISKDLDVFREAPLPRTVVAILGFIVTLGIVFYDQRNSQLYNALVRRGRTLERDLGIDGAFSQRPGRSLKFLHLFDIWHDRGLALIYGSVLGAWLFPIACGILWLIPNRAFLGTVPVPSLAALLAVVGGFLLILELHRLDRDASQPSGEPRPETKSADVVV